MKLDYLSDVSNSGIFQREIFVLFNSMKKDQRKLYCSLSERDTIHQAPPPTIHIMLMTLNKIHSL